MGIGVAGQQVEQRPGEYALTGASTVSAKIDTPNQVFDRRLLIFESTVDTQELAGIDDVKSARCLARNYPVEAIYEIYGVGYVADLYGWHVQSESCRESHHEA